MKNNFSVKKGVDGNTHMWSDHQTWFLLFFSYLKVTGFSYLRHNVSGQKSIDKPFIVVQSHFIDVAGGPIWKNAGPGD